MPGSGLIKALRLTHLYVGVFITPAILFFALTGALQTFGLHETNRDHPNYVPARWIVVLGQLHKKQTTVVPVRRLPPDPKPLATTPHPSPAASQTPSAQPERHNPLPLRIFFLIVALGLFTSTVTGLYMSYTYTRNKFLITVTLLAGIILPLLFILL